ncbi:glucose-6-phosphate dehydrogenase assembly protein OpcA [cf. Phormidesmis sp. LEGE 11477]|uniref:glucose-6-phosphate dehydrogenase assembly protein OpcA n=1 Tax=cf. Phormidesmis sp. LEGE 11477 TaxID=1828680 RepID=UPI00187FC7EE|nr:glucose-6-phosphate dehydrogenase assembly protein OpcA [cf. Phormidesmis sp. LEGE 11477]MBE9061741.1 glucose-6-phosphate dehydrogenase assembly protein OpcA [cf. Phormidesmis sp. LEGE 11477]
MATSLLALQKPKDISLDEIETELRNIWRVQDDGGSAPVATRATTFTLVVYEPDEIQQLLATLGYYDGEIDGSHGADTREAILAAQKDFDLRMSGRVDTETLARLRSEVRQLPEERLQFKNDDVRGYSFNSLAAQNPCRVITLCPTFGDDEGVSAQVSAYCPVQKSQSSNLVCCEYITLRGTKEALERVSDLVESLVVSDLPKFIWWKATPNPEQILFQKLAITSSCLILDSSYYGDAESEILKIQSLVNEQTNIADLNWYRLAPWQELTAEAFDPPERRMALTEVDRVGIDYERGNPAQALMFLGWLASRLDWQPVAYENEGGDYDLKRIRFKSESGREIQAELAAIPVANPGEVLGDLTGVRLESTNHDANCNTILCSETAGCMRMESGGSAQSSLVEEVTSLSDQRSDLLLEQQLQSWGEDVLFEESLAVTSDILELTN